MLSFFPTAVDMISIVVMFKTTFIYLTKKEKKKENSYGA